MEELKDAVRPIETVPRPEALARGFLEDVTSSKAPAPRAETDPPVSPTDTPANDGGPGSVY